MMKAHRGIEYSFKIHILFKYCQITGTILPHRGAILFKEFTMKSIQKYNVEANKFPDIGRLIPRDQI
jgi:hypothetical protein